MKYLTRRQNDNLFDVFDDFFKPMFYDEQVDGMRTDIRETDGEYKLDVELPGFDKSEIKVSLENGYLTIGAERKESEKEKDRYLRRECRVSCQRSFYVGDDVSEGDIRAKYENGMLRLTLPKVQPKKLEARSINID